MPPEATWEGEAKNWIAWARRPRHDLFSYFSPSFFDDLVPPASGRTLEIGCGEGRVARALLQRGHNVVALDQSPTLVRAARDLDRQSVYLCGDATALPFADGTVHLVVAYNALQTMVEQADMAKAVREARRVLQPGGHFCLSVAHPMTDVGRLQGVSANGTLTMTGSYFEHAFVNETVTKDDVTITFRGWTYTLEDYARAFEDAGFLIERVREPVPGPEQVKERPSLERWTRIPHFLSMRAVARD
jgi:SAM-dependent methyltransferase